MPAAAHGPLGCCACAIVVQSPVRRVLAKKAGLTSASTDVLYGGYMGCGWKRWSDEVGIAKLQMLLTAWEEKDTTFSKVMRGAGGQ